jgi:protein-S-isoprenylcysteine O-methyltransferase
LRLDELADLLTLLAVAVWVAVEIGPLRGSQRILVRGNQDGGTGWFLFLIWGAGIGVAVLLGRLRVLPLPAGWRLLGAVVLLSGVAFRLWAIRTLGRFFKLVVVIQDEHRLITAGPYSRLRHPSYTGALLAALGLGLAAGSALGAAVAVIAGILGLAPRIAVEERVMRERFGAEYQTWAAHTHRLIPGVW